MNINDPTGRLYPPPFGPPRFGAPPPFPPFGPGPQNPSGWGAGAGGLPPPLHPTNEQVPANLPPRLQLQMLLQIPLTGSQQQQQPYSSLPSLLDPQPPYHPPPFPQPPQFQGYNQPPPNFGFPSLLSSSSGGGAIPGLGDTQDLERLRALETALKEASRGTWQPPGVAPPPVMPPPIISQQETGDAIVARQAEAFIRELQARGHMFDYKHGRRDEDSDSLRRRRRSSSSSSSESDFGQRKKRRDGSDLEEGEVEEGEVESRFSDHHPQQLPPPLFGSGQTQDYYASTSHIAPLLPPDDRDMRERDRGRGRRGAGKNYRDFDAQEEGGEGGQVQQAAEKASTGKNSFDKLFSAYLSHKAKTSKDEKPPETLLPPVETAAQQPPPDIAPLLKTLGPSLQQALSAVGIQVPVSLGPTPQQTAPITTAPSLSYALSAFDRDIAQLGGGQVAKVEPEHPPLPPNVTVEVAGENSEWAAVAQEITSQLDKPSDQINALPNVPREIFPSRDNRATVALVQRMIPPIPMVERENVAQRVMEPPDYSTVPLLLPAKIVEERVFPPLKDTSSAGRTREQLRRRGMGPGPAAAPGWSKLELHDKARQARERVNHLKIEQGMVEERLIVMGDELRKLHRYFETNYGVKLVRPSDLEDPPELVALWKRREEDLRKKAAEDAISDVGSSAVVYGPEFLPHGDNSNEQPDENGPQEQQNFAAEEEQAEESGEVADESSAKVLKDRREGNRREKHWHGKQHARSNMRARVDAPGGRGSRKGRGGNSRGQRH